MKFYYYARVGNLRKNIEKFDKKVYMILRGALFSLVWKPCMCGGCLDENTCYRNPDLWYFHINKIDR